MMTFALSRENRELLSTHTLLLSLYKEIELTRSSYQQRMKQLVVTNGTNSMAIESSLDPNSLVFSEDLQAIRLVLVSLLKHLIPVGSSATAEGQLMALTLKLKELKESAAKRVEIQRQTLEAKISKTYVVIRLEQAWF